MHRFVRLVWPMLFTSVGVMAAITACVSDDEIPAGTAKRDAAASAGDSAIGADDAGLRFADCNGNPADGPETDLQSDPKHCGTCIRTCGGQACAGGLCVWEAIGDSPTNVDAVGVDDDAVYFTGGDDARVYAASKTGAAVRPLGKGTSAAHTLIVDDAVYTSAYNAGPAVGRYAKDGGFEVVSAQGLGLGVAVTRDAYYHLIYGFGGAPPMHLYRTDRSNIAAPREWGDAGAGLSTGTVADQITVDASRVYWIAKDGVHAANLDFTGGALVYPSPTARRVRSNGSILAVYEGNEITAVNLLSMQNGRLVGVAPTASGNGGLGSSLEFNGPYLYFTEATKLSRIDVTKNTVEVLAIDQGGATGIGFDSEYVYWGVLHKAGPDSPGQVRRVHK